ncbi:MAG TPA: galactokinase [Anaerolineales bacterium]|nr:galactokinase [Anaerolineales bacterium]
MSTAAGATRAFAEAFGAEPYGLASAPGRVNLIGEHTDYNDGWVLPVALDRRAWVVASPCDTHLVALRALDLDDSVTFRLTELEAGVDVRGRAIPTWARYPAGVAYVLQRAGHRLVGLDAVLTSDVPIGAGLSSSAAIDVAFGLVWNDVSGLGLDHVTLARVCQQAENEYVGVQCGLMDPFTALHAVEDHALLIDCRSLESRAVSLPPNLALVIADSGVRHELGASAYNLRRQECAEAAQLLSRRLPGVTSLRDVSPEQVEEARNALPPTLYRRALHVASENRRVLDAVDRLRAGDLAGLGAILGAGHASLRGLFEVSHPDVDTLVEIAAGLPGCHGSRLTGGGFGGSTVNLVEKAEAVSFASELASRYEAETGRKGQVWICRAGGAAAFARPS